MTVILDVRRKANGGLEVEEEFDLVALGFADPVLKANGGEMDVTRYVFRVLMRIRSQWTRLHTRSRRRDFLHWLIGLHLESSPGDMIRAFGYRRLFKTMEV